MCTLRAKKWHFCRLHNVLVCMICNFFLPQNATRQRLKEQEFNHAFNRRATKGPSMLLKRPLLSFSVVGGRNKPKSEMCVQTETSSAVVKQQQQQQQPFDWKQAMAHNARVLSSQEKAMDEYLRRQRNQGGQR